MEQVYSMEKPEELAGGRASPQSVCCQLETQGLAVPCIHQSLGDGGIDQRLQKKGVIMQKAALNMLWNSSYCKKMACDPFVT